MKCSAILDACFSDLLADGLELLFAEADSRLRFLLVLHGCGELLELNQKNIHKANIYFNRYRYDAAICILGGCKYMVDYKRT